MRRSCSISFCFSNLTECLDSFENSFTRSSCEMLPVLFAIKSRPFINYLMLLDSAAKTAATASRVEESKPPRAQPMGLERRRRARSPPPPSPPGWTFARRRSRRRHRPIRPWRPRDPKAKGSRIPGLAPVPASPSPSARWRPRRYWTRSSTRSVSPTTTGSVVNSSPMSSRVSWVNSAWFLLPILLDFFWLRWAPLDFPSVAFLFHAYCSTAGEEATRYQFLQC